MTECRGVKGSDGSATSWIADMLRAAAGVPPADGIDAAAEKDAWLQENGFRATLSLSPPENANMAGITAPALPSPNLVLVPRDAAYNPGCLVAMCEEFKRTKSIERALHAGVVSMLDYHQSHPIMPDTKTNMSVDEKGPGAGQRNLNEFYAAMTPEQVAMHLDALRLTAAGALAFDNATNLGMVIAATHVFKAHGKDGIAAEILHSAGLNSAADVAALGADRYDVDVAAAVLEK